MHEHTGNEIHLFQYTDDDSQHQNMMRPGSPSEAPPPHSARSHAQFHQRSPATMLDIRPSSARLPGYTGHQPGIVAESLLGRSFAYITGYRRDLLQSDDDNWLTDYHRNHSADGGLPTPKPPNMTLEAAAAVPRSHVAMPGAEKRFVWADQDRYYSVLNLNRTGRMPGYTGHTPHYRFSGSVGLPFAKACNIGDQLRPPDGSHCKYSHVEPHRTHAGPNRDDPIAGYAGFVPFMQESTTGLHYQSALDVCRATRSVEPAVLRKELDAVHSGYTPSMKEALQGAQPHSKDRKPYGNDRSALQAIGVDRDILQPRGTIAGYSGFRPGRGVSLAPPEVYKPRLQLLQPRKEKHLRGSIFIGDLTQEWNLGNPYWCTNKDYGSFAPHPEDALKIVQMPSKVQFPAKK